MRTELDYQTFEQPIAWNNAEQPIVWNNAELSCEILKNRVNDASRRRIPIRTATINNSSWINNDAKQTIGRRQRENEAKKRINSEETITEYIEAWRQVIRIVKQEKRNKELSISRICKHNPIRFYSYINERRIVSDNKARATQNGQNTRNYYLNSMFTVEQLKNVTFNMKVISLIFSTSALRKYMRSCNIWTHAGTQNLIFFSFGLLDLSHTYVFNSSVEKCIIPEDWKSANVTVIDKKGSRQEPRNYRHISHTTALCKTMERLVKGRLITHLEMNNLIGDSQHGFRNKRGCLTSLLDFFARHWHIWQGQQYSSRSCTSQLSKRIWQGTTWKTNAKSQCTRHSRWCRNW